MRTVAQILARKGMEVIKVTPITSVIEALQLMAEKNIGSVVVVENNTFLGIMTERDYSRKIVLKGKSSEKTTVADIMTSDFPSVTLQDKIDHCMKLFSTQNLRYLPVMENEKLIGVISISDVVTETILDQNETISHLQNYIYT